MADTQSNIQVNIDTTQALASIKNLQRQISAFHSSMAKGGAAANAVSAQMQQTLINSINSTGKFSAQIRTIRTTTESFTDSLEKNKFSLGEYFRHAGGASKTFGRFFKTEFATISKVARENVKDLQTQYISLGRDASGAMKSIAVRPLALDMTDLATRTQVAAQKQAILNQLLKQGSTNLLNFGKNTQWAGRQLMVGFTLPLIAVGSAAAKTFMDMETQAIRFKKVYGDLFTPNAESAQALKDIQELGKEFTKYGIAVSSTVGLAAEAAAAGFKGVDLTRQTTAATRLSILGQVESQKALETTIALQNAFSMSSENLAESIDFLNAVENQTVLSLDDVSTAIPKAAPIIQQLGGDVKDLAFFMTAMKEGGINASEGANAIKSGLASMINPTGKASAMLESFGINVKKIVVDNKGDLKKTVVEFATALNMLDPLNRAQAIEQMFGKFQFARLSTLFANVTKEGTQASRVLDLAGSSVQDLADLSEKELGMTSESAMNKFKGAVENLKLSLIPLGEQFLKAVTPIAEFITKILDKFNGLSDSTKKIIVVITSLVAGLGPVLLMTAGLVMNGLANMIKLFAFLKSAFNKTGQSTATLGTEVKYMTTEQRNAAAVAASLDQVHTKLAQTFTSEASAVNALTRAYQRAIAAQSQFVPVAPPITRGPIKKFAGGRPSTVGGTGNKDSELALLMPGETVIPTAMSKKYGSIINAMIADKIPGYDDGKPKVGSPSLYGGQSLKYSGLGVFAPGNTSSSALGMDKTFLMEGDAFLKSLTATAVGGGATLDDPVARLTRARTLEYHGAVKTFVPKIVEVLRSTVLEMEKNGENIDSIEDVTRRARPKLEKIFGQMTAQGGKAASSATALRQHLFFPGQAEMGGQFGETRVPGARRSSSGKIKDTMYRIKGSPFQSRVKTAYRNLYGANPEGSYAHMNESRMLGDTVPLRGGALALPASEQAPLAARVRAKARQIKTDFAGGGITKRRSGTEKAAIRQSGADDKREYVRGADSVDGKDPYMQTRDRKSPHRQAARDGRDDARAYTAARDKELTQAGRKRRVATRPQGPAPIGATPQPGATILPIVPGGPGTPPDPNTTDSKKPTRMQAAGSRINSMGGGMGLLGVNMGLSMLPDFAGKGMVQGTLAGANLGMMFGGYGMVAGAAIGTVTTAITALIAKEKEHAANVRSTFIPSTGIISLFGDKVLDTTTRIISLNGATDNLKSSLGIVSKEVQAVVNAIEGLPEEDPLFKFVEKISNQDFNLSSLTGEIRSKVATEISVGGLDPKNAQAYVQALLVAANRSRDFADVWQSVSKSVINAQEATAVGFEKMYQAVAKTGESFIRVTEDYYTDPITGLQVLVREEYSKTYDDLTDTQKIFSDSMLNMFNIVSNGSLTFDQINERIAGLRDASFNSAEAVAALTAAINNTGKKDLIERLAAVKQLFKDTGTEAEMSVDKIIAMATALNTISDENLIKFAEKNNISILPGSGKYILEEYMKSEEYKEALTLQKKLRDALFNNDYVDTTGGVNGLSKASEAYLKVLDAEIKGLEEKRDAQKNVNDESQRHIDLQMKMKGLANEVVLAKISGDYIKAASLEQQAQNLQMEFDQDTEIRKKDAEIARLKDRAQDIRDGAKLSRSEIAKIPKPVKKVKEIKRASGGMIRGAGTGTSDSIPALLSNGEYVIKAKSVKKYGVGALDALNAGRFAEGGLIRTKKDVSSMPGKFFGDTRKIKNRRYKDNMGGNTYIPNSLVVPNLRDIYETMNLANGGLIPTFGRGGIVGNIIGGIGKFIANMFGKKQIVKEVAKPSFKEKVSSKASSIMDLFRVPSTYENSISKNVEIEEVIKAVNAMDAPFYPTRMPNIIRDKTFNDGSGSYQMFGEKMTLGTKTSPRIVAHEAFHHQDQTNSFSSYKQLLRHMAATQGMDDAVKLATNVYEGYQTKNPLLYAQVQRYLQNNHPDLYPLFRGIQEGYSDGSILAMSSVTRKKLDIRDPFQIGNIYNQPTLKSLLDTTEQLGPGYEFMHDQNFIKGYLTSAAESAGPNAAQIPFSVKQKAKNWVEILKNFGVDQNTPTTSENYINLYDHVVRNNLAKGGLVQGYAGGGPAGKIIGGIGKFIAKLFGGKKIVKPKPQTTIIPKLGSLSPAAMAKLTPEERAFHFAGTDLDAMKTMLTSDVSSMSVPITGVSFNPNVAEAGLAYIKSGLGRIPGASSKKHTASIWEFVQSQREALLTAKYPKADLSDVKTFNELYAKEFYGLGKDDLVTIFKGTRTTKPAGPGGSLRDWRTHSPSGSASLDTYFSTNPYIAAEYAARISDPRTLGSELPMFSMNVPVSQLKSRFGEGAIHNNMAQGSFEFPQVVDGAMLAAQTPKPYYLPTQVYGQMFPPRFGDSTTKVEGWPFNFANGGLIPGFSGIGSKLANGGTVLGRGTATSDSIPAYLSNGEYVVQAKSVKKYGVETLDALNAGRFATGGQVGRSASSYIPRLNDGGIIPAFGGGGIVGKLLGGIGKAISKLFVGKSMGKPIKPNEVETFLSDTLGGATLPKIKKQELPAGVGGQYIPRFSDPASNYENLLPHILLNSKYKVQGNTAIHETMHHFDMDVMHDSFRRTIAKLRKDGKTDLADEYESLFVTAENKQKGMGLAVWEDRAITLQDYDSLTYFGGAAEAFADENTFKAYTKFMSSPKIKDKKLALKIGNPYGPGFSTDRLRGYFKTYSQFEHNALNMPMRLNPSFLRGLVENSPNMPQKTKDVYLAWAEGLERFKPPARSNPEEIRNSLQFQNFRKYITDNKLDKAEGFHKGGLAGHRHGSSVAGTKFAPGSAAYYSSQGNQNQMDWLAKRQTPKYIYKSWQLLPKSMQPDEKPLQGFRDIFNPMAWGIGKDLLGQDIDGAVDLPYKAYKNIIFPTITWADRVAQLGPLSQAMRLLRFSGVDLGGSPYLTSTNRNQEAEWIKRSQEEGFGSVAPEMALQQGLDISGLLPWNRIGGAIGNVGISKTVVARIAAEKAAEKAALKAHREQNGIGTLALLQSIKSKFTPEYAKNLKLRSKFEAIKAEGKILTPEGEMARYELAISDALIASRKNNFTPLMHLKNATPEQLIAEHKALPSLIEEPFELNGKSYVFRFHKAALNDGDTRNIEYFLNDIKTSNGIGMSDTATGFNLAEIIDPSTGMQAAYIRYDPITGHIRRRETDVPYRMQHLSAALYNKAAEITRIRHSSSLTQAGRASSPLIGGFMSHDNIFNIPGMVSSSGPSSLTTFLQKFIPKPKKPKKPKEQELTTSDSNPADYSGSGLTDEQWAEYQARNNPSGSSITPNTRVFADESPEATARREAAMAGTRQRARQDDYDNNLPALLAAWRGNLYRTYNTYPFSPYNGAYDLADDYDLEMLMQLRGDWRNAPAQVPWRDNSQRPAPVTFPGKDWDTSAATGGFLDKGKLRVPKFANGGLIKGPGTGISDSIQAGFGYAGGGSIRVSNGEYVVKASSVRDYGVKTMDAINKGTATVGTEAGGTVYNINMPVTSNNANPEIVANEVMRKLKLEISKNNKTNKVGG